VQQPGCVWESLPADLLTNVLEHLPRDDPSNGAIRQTCRWALGSIASPSTGSSWAGYAVHAGLWSAFSEPTGLTYLKAYSWCADEAVDVWCTDCILHFRPPG